MTLLYRFLLSAIILIAANELIFAQKQPWTKIQSPVSETLLNLSFVDSLTGWAAGESGTIIKTTDGGNSWEIQNSTVHTTISDLCFADKNYGWALTLQDGFPFTSVIIKTSNGGTDWVAQNFPDTTVLLRTIFFFDSLNGFIGGSYIAYTSDGGKNWTEANVDSNLFSNFPVYQFNFIDRQFGYACGGRIDIFGVVWRTTDSGLNWTSTGISPDEIYDIYIFDSLNAVTLSGDPEGFFGIVNIKTTDAGISWSSDELPFTGLSFAIDFRTYYEGWSASGYKFLLTTDRGETWEEFEPPDSAAVFDLQFTDAKNGYAVGENGVILKFDATSVGVKPELRIPDNYILYQNFPNPFNPSTKIRFQIPIFETVTLKIFDILGNEVSVLINESLHAGEYEFEFHSLTNNKHLVSGIYFYTLRAGEFSQTKKMVYLK